MAMKGATHLWAWGKHQRHTYTTHTEGIHKQKKEQ